MKNIKFLFLFLILGLGISGLSEGEIRQIDTSVITGAPSTSSELSQIMDDIHKFNESGAGNGLMVTYDPEWVEKNPELNAILKANGIHYTDYIKYKIIKGNQGVDVKNLNQKLLSLGGSVGESSSTDNSGNGGYIVYDGEPVLPGRLINVPLDLSSYQQSDSGNISVPSGKFVNIPITDNSAGSQSVPTSGKLVDYGTSTSTSSAASGSGRVGDYVSSSSQTALSSIIDDIRKFSGSGEGLGLMITYDPLWTEKNKELNKILEANGIHYTTYIQYKIIKNRQGVDISNLDSTLLSLGASGNSGSTAVSGPGNIYTGINAPLPDDLDVYINTGIFTGDGPYPYGSVGSSNASSSAAGGAPSQTRPLSDYQGLQTVGNYANDGLPADLIETVDDSVNGATGGLTIFGSTASGAGFGSSEEPKVKGPTTNTGAKDEDEEDEENDEEGDETGSEDGEENDANSSEGEPVLIPDGNFYSTEKDLVGKYDCHTFNRYYNSLRQVDAGFGTGWGHSFSWQLRKENDEFVIYSPELKKFVFENNNGAYTAKNPANFSKLTSENGSFILSFPDGKKYVFYEDANKKTIHIAGLYDLEGLRQEFEYDSTGTLLKKVKDKQGNFVTFYYNETGHIIKVTDNAGRSVSYSYNVSTGSVSEASRPDGSKVNYSYDSRENLEKKIFADGTVLISTYDNRHRTLKQFLGRKLIYEFRYDDKDKKILYYELGKLAKTYFYDDNKNLTRIVFDNGAEEKKYNGKQLVTEYINAAGDKTLFAYDNNGNVIRKTYPDGAVEKFGFDEYSRLIEYISPLGNTTRIVYKGAKPEKMINPEGAVTSFEYDKNGFLVKVDYPDGGKIVYERDEKGNALKTDNNGVISKFSYDLLGNVNKEISPSGLVTEYAYNFLNKPTLVKKISGTESYEMGYKYDPFGNVTEIKDALERVTTLEWVEGFFNRVEKITDPEGNPVVFSYDEVGNLLSKTDRNGNTWSYAYNVNNRLVSVTDPFSHSIKAAYDSRGNLIEEISRDKIKRAFEYDSAGRIVKVSTAERADKEIKYDIVGNIVEVFDGNGNPVKYKYNKTGKVIETIDAENISTLYGYDNMGRILSITDGEGNATRYSYDKTGKVIRIEDGEGLRRDFVYDKAGRLTRKTFPDGSSVNYQYDSFNRITKIVYPDDTVAYEHDAVGNITSMKNNFTEIAYKYDSLNRVVEERDVLTNKVIAYTYDKEGNRRAFVLNDNYVVNYGYDELNRLAFIENSGKKFKYSYSPGGRTVEKKYPNNMAVNYEYNPYGRMDSINVCSAGEVIDSFKYEYDNAGNIVKEINRFVKHEYLYDKAYRLLKETANGAVTKYQYDKANNRIAMLNDSEEIYYTYNNANQLLKAGDAHFEYDARGNIIKEGSKEYSYDYNNRMVSAKVGAKDVNYTYDPLGRRLTRNNTKYIYDGFKVIREKESGLLGSHAVTYLRGSSLDEILSRSASPSVYYYEDIRGSVRGIADANSNLIQSYEYTAFGERTTDIKQKHFLFFDKGINQPYGFTGRPIDKVTGLYDYRFRDYNPEIGRFIQPDPLGQIPGPNIYAYCNNNPINWVDPWGMDAVIFNDSDGAYSFGHNAIAIGNDNTGGWDYYSQDGPGIGGKHHHYNTYKGMMAAQTGLNGEGGRYDRNIRIESTLQQDQSMRTVAESNLHNEYNSNPFDDDRYHCGDLVNDTLEAGNISHGEEGFGNPPNAAFDNIVKEQEKECK